MDRRLNKLKQSKSNFYLTGKFVVAMPFPQDNQFMHRVIYICGHDEQGAIGLVINKKIPNYTLTELAMQLQLNIGLNTQAEDIDIYYGGSIESTRGFVLHTHDYQIDSTVNLNNKISITSTLEILRSISNSKGPKKFLILMGYTSWAAGQLENEIQENDWMIIDSSENLIFNTHLRDKWKDSMASIGVNPAILSLQSGHA